MKHWQSVSPQLRYHVVFVAIFTRRDIILLNCTIPGSGFTRPGLRIDNSVLTGETSRRPRSARHGIPVADPFQDRDLLQPQGALTLVWRYSSMGPNRNSV